MLKEKDKQIVKIVFNKNNPHDMEVFNWLKMQGNCSGYLKTLLDFVMHNKGDNI